METRNANEQQFSIFQRQVNKKCHIPSETGTDVFQHWNWNQIGIWFFSLNCKEALAPVSLLNIKQLPSHLLYVS